ncbi:MAG: Hsp20/alpha crystallin family protein [Acidobacteria bacterium]|nr:Hsp20/alpha crystallin family protein [Acidobacteriota bacterium]
MAFTGWDPLRDLLAIQRGRVAPGPGGWVPPVDIHETTDHYVITAELPGLKREDIRIHVENGRVTLEGVRRDQGTCEQYHRIERGHGAFSRTFQLPAPVDADGIEANLHDGILIVTCPKATDPSPRRVHVTQS